MGQPGNSTFTWQHALQLHSTLSPFDSPFPTTHPAFKNAPRISWTRLHIAGILLTIYGLEELPPRTHSVSILWLLHGRGDTQDSMSFVASHLLTHYYKSLQSLPLTSPPPSLLAITLDHRNHGSRMIHNPSNLSWNQGNATHGPDMFNTYTGTAADVSHLIPHIPNYLPANLKIKEHLACGLSLGGHATWTLLVNEPAIRAGIAIVGCPDYVRVMTDRAIRAKLASCMRTDPPGREFLGSEDFPRGLVEAVERLDPAGVFLGELDTVTGEDWRDEPGEREKERLRPILRERLGGKRVLCVGGGKDRLVPVEMGEPFLEWVGKATDGEKGWAREVDFGVETFVDPSARHECSVRMRGEIERWLVEYLVGKGGSRSKL